MDFGGPNFGPPTVFELPFYVDCCVSYVPLISHGLGARASRIVNYTITCNCHAGVSRCPCVLCHMFVCHDACTLYVIVMVSAVF